MIDDDEVIPEEDDVFEEEMEEVEEFNPSGNYNNAQLEEWANQFLRTDSNRELCLQCKNDNRDNPTKYPNETPYGEETGRIESVPQVTKDDEPLVDEEDNQLYIDYPEFVCERGHKWYKGEGPRRDIKGPNPILFKSHLENRTRREIQSEAGVADPAFSKGRFGQPGMYNRVNPDGGRKQNTTEQRKRNGASFFGSSSPAEAWGWRLSQHEKTEENKMTTRKMTPEEIAALPVSNKRLTGEEKRDLRQSTLQ